MRRLSGLVATDRHVREVLVADGADALGTFGVTLSQDERLVVNALSSSLAEALLSPDHVRRHLADMGTFELVGPGPKAGRPRIALVVMPFASIRYPAIGVSILQRALLTDGFEASVLYPNLDLAHLVGVTTYEAVGVNSPPTALAGDWAFRAGESSGNHNDYRYVEDVLLDRHPEYFDIERLFRLSEVRSVSDLFIEQLASDSRWEMFDLVGFTSMFQQQVAVLRLAEALRERYQHLPIVLGGANCEGPMGEAIADNYPMITCISQGEADHEFSRVARSLLSQTSHTSSAMISHTDAPGARTTSKIVRCDPVTDMDTVPTPHYDDFYNRFHLMRKLGIMPVPFETSRGCWWGEKQHCTFCGLNGTTMQFRSKSPDRALSELKTLVEAWGGNGPTWIQVVDNILDYRYLESFIPLLADSPLDVRLHFEIKANVRLDQLQILARAGISHLQPGIESFSNHVLKLMRKGTTRLRNIQTLKWCKELKIDVAWNYLYGFPGERDNDYTDLPEVFDLIMHLDPPARVGPARADRFSPFHSEPATHGITELRREPAYDFIYHELTEEDRDRIAYHFELRGGSVASGRVVEATTDAAHRWREGHDTATLTGTWRDGRLHVRDTRLGRDAAGRLILEPETSAVAVAIDRAASPSAVQRQLGGEKVTVQQELDRLVELGLALADQDAYLGLTVLDRESLPDHFRSHPPTSRPRPRTRIPVRPVGLAGHDGGHDATAPDR